MAEFDKVLMDEAAGRELAKQAKKYTDDHTVTPAGMAAALAEYDKSTEVDKKINEKIAASEKKIFGDGELADAFDTIQEIGAYLKDHDDVGTGLAAEINKRVKIQDYNQDKEELEGKIEELKKAVGTDGSSDGNSLADRIDTLETTVDNIPSVYQTQEAMNAYETREQAEGKYIQPQNVRIVSAATVQSWFAD